MVIDLVALPGSAVLKFDEWGRKRSTSSGDGGINGNSGYKSGGKSNGKIVIYTGEVSISRSDVRRKIGTGGAISGGKGGEEASRSTIVINGESVSGGDCKNEYKVGATTESEAPSSGLMRK